MVVAGRLVCRRGPRGHLGAAVVAPAETAMETAPGELKWIGRLLERLHNAKPRELRLDRRWFHRGLEAAGVARVSARYVDHHGRPRVFTLVVKQLEGATTRERLIYERVVKRRAAELAPRLLGSQQLGPERAVLYLESLRPTTSWPWRETRATHGVLDCVRRLHAWTPDAAAIAALSAWNYEAELQHAAELTLARLDRIPRRPELAPLRRGLRWARRVTASLRSLRRELLGFAPLGQRVIHGDLHPGNVVLRRRSGQSEPVLIDWGRARLGSPLEDVSSWLQSLGCWEPVARRRHDTLLVGYLSAAGMAPPLSADLRAAYWFAGASNALAGALLHHVSVVLDVRASSAERTKAIYMAREWLRVLRRADAFWS